MILRSLYMKVFMSWSGKRSRDIARKISDWLPKVIENIEVWMSDSIPPGANWFEKITKELADAKHGIICVTRENLNSQWLHFEAGALANRFGNDNKRVCPILIGGVTPSELKEAVLNLRAI